MINFHNKFQQSLLFNLKDNDCKTQFPFSGINANHPQARHESTMLSSNDNDEDTDKHCKIINNFNAQIYDENESKYLHVIDYDMQDPVSVIGNFQQAKNGHQSLKGTSTNTSDNLSDVGSDFVVRINETNSNLRQDSNLDKQLADNANTGRLHEKQTKPHKNTPRNNNIMEVEIGHGNFEENIQPRSKVKNLIHDYELQVQEQSNHRKSEKKHGDQFESILDTNGVESSYTNNGSTKNNTNHIPTVDSEEPLLNGSHSFHEQEIESQEIVTKSDSKVNDTVYRRSMTKQNNTSDILDSNARKQFSSARSLQSSPSDKNLKPVTQVINTDVDCSTTKDTTISLAGSNQGKQSTNGGDTNYYHLLKFRNGYQNFIDDYDQSSLSNTREMTSSYPVEAFSGGSKVTRAHWYDIHSSSEKSSQGIKPLILEQGNALKPRATGVNTHETSPQMLDYDLATGNSFHQRRWKSLGELDKVDQVEEYKLPDKLNKTTYPVVNDEDTTHGVNNLDTTLLSSIPGNRDFNLLPRYGTNQRGQKLHSNRTEPFSPHAKTVTQSQLQSNRNYAQNTKNSQMVSLGIENKNAWQHNARGAQQSPTPARNKYLGNKSNSRENRAHMYNINNTEKIIPGCKTDDISTTKHSPLLAKKHGKIMAQPVNKYSDSSKISIDNFTTERWNYSPIKRSPSPTRKREKLSGRFQKVNKSSEHLNHLRDDNNNLSRSLTHLETLDQSPMKRSPKIKNLVDIEYYDIASDEELNSKITRRPRTKSLNDENRTMEYVVPKREFKSSGDLRTVGLTQQEIAAENKDEETASRIDSNSGGSLRTHGKYTDLYADSVSYNKHSKEKIQSYDPTYPSLGPRTNPCIEVSSHNKSLNRYERHSQGPQVSNTDSTMSHALSNNGNKHYSIQSQYGRSHFGSSKSVEHITQKENHVRNTNNTNLTNDLKQSQSTIKRLKSPLHNSNGNTANINYTARHQKGKSAVNTVKRFPNPLQNRFASKIDSSGKQAKNTRDPASKSIVYPVEDYRLTQGKYNIAKAEKEWRKRYGKLPYNNKDPLHQSSDNEFGRLFQHSERNSGNRNSLKENDLAKQHFSLEESIGDTSSSSVFGTNRIDNDDASIKNSHSKDFSTTLNKLSSYLLSSYKNELTQNSPLHAQEETKSETTVKFRRFYLDDEGDLSHVLDDPKESPKLSMLVHAIIRLREVYSVQPYAKPQTPDHPTNLGNPQLRDAIQNKPMSVVKDLILANKSVDINIRSQSGDSALHRAAAEGDLDAIRIMINQGANVNIRDRNGFQPVHQALRCHNYKAAMFLMDCGTDLMSYTSKRIQEFMNVKAIAKQYLRQTLKTPL